MDWREIYDAKVPMRDGVMLACDIRMPSAEGPFPAVLLRTPYNKDVQPGSRLESLAHFVDHGYAMVTMDVRGKYESDGRFPALSLRQEGVDGVDTIAWIAAQPWCNGQVAMTGASYCGYVQMYAANLNHPALVCITPGVFGNDGFRNIMRCNGVPQMSLLVWALRFSTGRVAKNPLTDWEKLFREVPLLEMPERCGIDADVVRQWLTHNVDDEFWHGLGSLSAIGNIVTPAFMSGGWYDIYSSAVLESFRILRGRPELRDRVRVLIGPWPHGMGGRQVGELDFGDTAEVDIVAENRRWIDFWCMKRGDAGAWPAVRLFVMGVNRWLDADAWPVPQTVDEVLLAAADTPANSRHGGGRLDSRHGGLEHDSFISDPARPMINIGGNFLGLSERFAPGPFDQRTMEDRDDMLVFTGPELAEPLAVIGTPEVELWIASTAPDADFVVRLCDVWPDGRSINICTGICRTRYRDGFDREVMMETGRRYLLRITLDVTANVFLTGHRLRLEVAGSSFPQFARNHQTGGDNCTEIEFRRAEQTIFHSPSHPTRLILPVYRGTGLADNNI